MESALSLLGSGDGSVTARARPSYDEDLHAWALWQAEMIRRKRFDELDLANLSDEVEDVARRERRELVSRLSLVIQHLLKWDHQPERRSASWARTLREQRTQVEDILNESPSLRSHLEEVFDVAFRQGRVAALNETGLPDEAITERNPYGWVDLMTRRIVWPES